MFNKIKRENTIPQKEGILVDQTVQASYSLHNPEICSTKDVNRVEMKCVDKLIKNQGRGQNRVVKYVS